MKRLLAFLIVLTGCSPSDRNIRQFSSDTQIWQTVSRDAEVFRDGQDHIAARAIILERHGQTRYYLSLSILRGGPNGPIILSVQSDGIPLAYKRHDRLNAFCIDHCHKTEVGAVGLSEYAFRSAANQGMTLQIDGRRRNYTARVPGHIFWSALEASGQLPHSEPQ